MTSLQPSHTLGIIHILCCLLFLMLRISFNWYPTLPGTLRVRDRPLEPRRLVHQRVLHLMDDPQVHDDDDNDNYDDDPQVHLMLHRVQ